MRQGYGTVRFGSQEDAQKAIVDFHGTDLEGRTLTVKFDKCVRMCMCDVHHHSPGCSVMPAGPWSPTVKKRKHALHDLGGLQCSCSHANCAHGCLPCPGLLCASAAAAAAVAGMPRGDERRMRNATHAAPDLHVLPLGRNRNGLAQPLPQRRSMPQSSERLYQLCK